VSEGLTVKSKMELISNFVLLYRVCQLQKW